MVGQYLSEPTPHIYLDRVVSPEVYKQAVFPALEPQAGGRIGRDLYRGEDGFDELMASPGWSEIYRKLTSADFIAEVLKTFASDMSANGCLVDANKFYLEQYIEPRKEQKDEVLSTDYPPEALFYRFDLQAADSKYVKRVHVDWARRIVGGLFYFCSAEEEGMEGGALGFFKDEGFRNDRVCHKPTLAKEFPIRHNTGVLFLNCNTGFHAPLPIHRISGLRKWVYYSISSRRNIWPAERAAVEPQPFMSRVRAKLGV